MQSAVHACLDAALQSRDDVQQQRDAGEENRALERRVATGVQQHAALTFYLHRIKASPLDREMLTVLRK